MVRTVRRLLFGLFLLVIAACGGAGARTSTSASTSATTSRELHALFDMAWDHALEEDPVWASTQGDMRHADRWTDTSLAAIERRHAYDQGLLQRIGRIDRAQLSKE